MKFCHKIILVCWFTGLLVYWLAKPALAASFSLEPTSGSFAKDQTFTVKINLNTGADLTTSAEALLIFDGSILDVSEVAYTSFYPQYFKNITSGKVYIGGAVQNPTDTKTGSGLFANLTFKGKAAGSSTVRFDCTAGKTTDSNVTKNDSQATDVLDCSSLTTGSYTVTGGSGSSPTSMPTFGPTCSVSPTGQLPRSGNFEPTLLVIGAGGILTFLGILFKLVL